MGSEHRNSAFGPPRCVNSLLRVPPPLCHTTPYLTGGLKELYASIANRNSIPIHDHGSFTDDEGHFQPTAGMPLLASRYRFTDVIGSGQSAVFIKAEDTFQKGNDNMVSIKALHSHYQDWGVQEMDCIRKLNAADPFDHSHTLRLLNTFTFDEHYCMVFELLDPKPLLRYFKKLKPGPEKLQLIRRVTLHLLQALGFLQHQNVIHADLKPDNILLKHAGDFDSLKVVDFGNAIHCVHKELSLYYDDFELQSLLYRAPEVVYGVPFGMEVDMWSLGCILAELYMGHPLFYGKDKADIIRRMVKLLGPLPQKHFQRGKFHSELAKFTTSGKQREASSCLAAHLQCKDYVFGDFLLGLMKYDPGERLTVSEAAQHPFLAPLLGLRFLLPLGTNTDNGKPVGYPTILLDSSTYHRTPKISPEVANRYMSSLQLLHTGTFSTAVAKSSPVAEEAQVTAKIPPRQPKPIVGQLVGISPIEPKHVRQVAEIQPCELKPVNRPVNMVKEMQPQELNPLPTRPVMEIPTREQPSPVSMRVMEITHPVTRQVMEIPTHEQPNPITRQVMEVPTRGQPNPVTNQVMAIPPFNPNGNRAQGRQVELVANGNSWDSRGSPSDQQEVVEEARSGQQAGHQHSPPDQALDMRTHHRDHAIYSRAKAPRKPDRPVLSEANAASQTVPGINLDIKVEADVQQPAVSNSRKIERKNSNQGAESVAYNKCHSELGSSKPHSNDSQAASPSLCRGDTCLSTGETLSPPALCVGLQNPCASKSIRGRRKMSFKGKNVSIILPESDDIYVRNSNSDVEDEETVCYLQPSDWAESRDPRSHGTTESDRGCSDGVKREETPASTQGAVATRGDRLGSDSLSQNTSKSVDAVQEREIHTGNVRAESTGLGVRSSVVDHHRDATEQQAVDTTQSLGSRDVNRRVSSGENVHGEAKSNNLAISPKPRGIGEKYHVSDQFIDEANSRKQLKPSRKLLIIGSPALISIDRSTQKPTWVKKSSEPTRDVGDNKQLSTATPSQSDLKHFQTIPRSRSESLPKELTEYDASLRGGTEDALCGHPQIYAKRKYAQNGRSAKPSTASEDHSKSAVGHGTKQVERTICKEFAKEEPDQTSPLLLERLQRRVNKMPKQHRCNLAVHVTSPKSDLDGRRTRRKMVWAVDDSLSTCSDSSHSPVVAYVANSSANKRTSERTINRAFISAETDSDDDSSLYAEPLASSREDYSPSPVARNYEQIPQTFLAEKPVKQSAPDRGENSRKSTEFASDSNKAAGSQSRKNGHSKSIGDDGEPRCRKEDIDQWRNLKDSDSDAEADRGHRHFTSTRGNHRRNRGESQTQTRTGVNKASVKSRKRKCVPMGYSLSPSSSSHGKKARVDDGKRHQSADKNKLLSFEAAPYDESDTGSDTQSLDGSDGSGPIYASYVLDPSSHNCRRSRETKTTQCKKPTKGKSRKVSTPASSSKVSREQRGKTKAVAPGQKSQSKTVTETGRSGNSSKGGPKLPARSRPPRKLYLAGDINLGNNIATPIANKRRHTPHSKSTNKQVMRAKENIHSEAETASQTQTQTGGGYCAGNKPNTVVRDFFEEDCDSDSDHPGTDEDFGSSDDEVMLIGEKTAVDH